MEGDLATLTSRWWDCVVVGGGHNGLAAAAYLAAAGLSVLMLERRATVGGACTLERPFADEGYVISPCAYVVGLLDPLVIDELGLRHRGYRVQVVDPHLWCPFTDGTSLTLWGDDVRTAASVACAPPCTARGSSVPTPVPATRAPPWSTPCTPWAPSRAGAGHGDTCRVGWAGSPSPWPTPPAPPVQWWSPGRRRAPLSPAGGYAWTAASWCGPGPSCPTPTQDHGGAVRRRRPRRLPPPHRGVAHREPGGQGQLRPDPASPLHRRRDHRPASPVDGDHQHRDRRHPGGPPGQPPGQPAPEWCELYFHSAYDPSVAPAGRPFDVEARIGLTGGHIFQGECLPDQMWDRRLSPRTPIPGVYLCGAATHPGGGVSAVNGRNAAMAVLDDLRSEA